METLICSSEVYPEPSAIRELPFLISQVKDMAGLVESAIREGLACLLYKNLLRAKVLDKLEGPLRERLLGCYNQTVLVNLRMIHDLKEILGLANNKRIPLVLLQGIVMLQEIYRDPGLRPMRDIDLWVLEEHFPPLEGILHSLGYMQDSSYPNTFRKGLTLIDVHTHILWADRIRAMAGLLAGDQNQLFNAALPIHFEGQEALCLQPCDQVLYLALHILKHNAGKLIWLVDLRFLLARWKKEDWLSLAARARALDLERPTAQVLYLLSHFFECMLPAEVSRTLGKGRLGLMEKKVLSMRIKGHHLPFFAPLFLLTAGRDAKKRLSVVREKVFPRPEILRQIFEDCRNSGLGVLYWKRICYLLKQIRNSLKRV